MPGILEGMSEESIRAYAELAVALEKNPETRLPTMALVKKVYPNRNLPELAMQEREQALRKELNDKLDEEIKKRELADLSSRRELMISQAIADEKVEDRAEFEKIEKHGIDNGISKFDVALSHYRTSSQESSTSSAPIMDYGPPTPPPMEGLKERFKGNVRQWAEAEAYKALDEIRAGKVKLSQY